MPIASPRRATTPINRHSSHPRQSTPLVAFEHASMRVERRTLWDDVNFTVRPGEFVAILGPNGAGKSTLLRAILGLQPLSEGSVHVLGETARRGNPAVGYVPQRRTFEADVRVRGRDLVRLGLDGERWGLPLPWGQREQEARAQVQSALDRVDAAEYADRPIGELSGGEQQRVLIAQALVTQPQILLLDEPLDSLDLPRQRAVASLIHQISRESQTAVLLVAHDVNPLLGYLDRVLYIARGHTAIGTPDEIITSETLSHLYESPIDVITVSDGRRIVVGQPEGVTFHADHDR